MVVRVNEHRDIDLAYVEKLEQELAQLRELVKAVEVVPQKTLSGQDEEEDHEEDDETLTRDSSSSVAQLQAKIVALMRVNAELQSLAREKHDSRRHASTQDDVVALEHEVANLKEKNQRMADIIGRMKELSDEFFAFEIEEEDLKTQLDSLLRFHKRVLPTAITARSSTPKASSSCTTPLGPTTNLRNTTPPKLESSSTFRVRTKTGKTTTTTDRLLTDHPHPHHGARVSDGGRRLKSEREIEAELAQAKRAMKKQAKLQSWLMEKEKRELARIQSEQQEFEHQRKQQSQRDAKFFKRAKAVKEKLSRQAPSLNDDDDNDDDMDMTSTSNNHRHEE